MKIVHIIDYFQPKIGYQEYFLAKEQKVLGHQVIVITSDRYYPFPDYNKTFQSVLGKRIQKPGDYQELGIRVIRLPIFFEAILGKQLWIRNFKSTLEKLKPDIVHCHNVYSLTALRSALLKESLNYTLVYDTHSASYNTNFYQNWLSKLFHLTYHLIIRPQILKKAQALYAIGYEEKEFIAKDLKISKQKVPIIPLGADTNRFKFSDRKRQMIRKKYKIGNLKLIVFSGKINPSKQVDVLLEAASFVKQAALMIIGNGNRTYIDYLKNKYRDSHIIWLNLVKNIELPDYYSAADVGCWPGNPSNTMLEAMACGLPIVVPNWPESQYLRKSGAVEFFQKGDNQDLRNKLKKLINNNEIRSKFRQNAQNFIKKNLSWRKITQDTVKFYQKCLEQPINYS